MCSDVCHEGENSDKPLPVLKVVILCLYSTSLFCMKDTKTEWWRVVVPPLVEVCSILIAAQYLCFNGGGNESTWRKPMQAQGRRSTKKV